MMRKLSFYVAIILCLVLIVPVAGGCSKTEEQNTFEKLLSLLPVEAKEGRAISIIDYESFRKVNGISLYDEDSNKITKEVYTETIMNTYNSGDMFGVDILWYSSDWTGILNDGLFSPITHENIGYSITDVNAEINNIQSLRIVSPGAGEYNDNLDALVAAVGDFNAQSTKDALENRSEWPSWAKDNFVSEEHEKIAIYSWGDGLEIHLGSRYEPPHIDPIGRAVPLAVSDGQFFFGGSTADIKSAIDASMNKKSSLADIPEYVLVAQYMHDLNTIGLLIMDEVLLPDALDAPESIFGPKLKNFTTVGMGLGKDDKGEYMALVIVFDNTVAAEEGFSALEQKVEVYNKIYDMNDNNNKYYIYDTEISVDNIVLSAKLYTGHKSLWRHWFINLWPVVFKR